MDLQNHPELFRLFLEHTPAAVAMFDREMRYVATTRRWLTDYGFDLQSLIGQSEEEMEPEIPDQWKAVYRRCLAGAVESCSADTFVRLDGSVEWVKWESRPWYDQNGEIGGVIFFTEIITERKHAEDALRASEAQLHQYQENLQANLHRNTELREVIEQLRAEIIQRKQAEKALQQSEVRYRYKAQREQIVNRLANQIRNSLDLDTVLQTAIQEIQQLLQVDYCIFSWYKPNTEPPTWEAIKEAKNPELPSLLGSYLAAKVGAVTEKIFNQEILCIDHVATFSGLIHRQLLQSLGFQSEIVLPIKTVSGNIGAIACGNSSSSRPWTQSEIELLQAVVDQLGIAINQAELYAQAHTIATTAQNQAQQLEQTLAELKRTQTQLVQSEKMSSLGQLVAGVAHEINNPVNFIYGNLAHANGYTHDLIGLVKLYQKAYPQLTPEILEEIEAIDLDFLITDLPKLMSSMKVGADRIRSIVRSLRNFSRHDEAEIKAVEIHEGIDSTLMILQHRLKNKPDHPEIEIIKQYGDLPPIECCAGQLNQVFMNLLANAIDALEEGVGCGVWGLEKKPNPTPHTRQRQMPFLSQTLREQRGDTPQIRITTEVSDGELVAIRIADNGSGMTPEVQKHLFDPFFTTKPVGVGTGLGLSISYQIVVELHGGQLYCNSEVGIGTEFVVKIPVYQKSNKS